MRKKKRNRGDIIIDLTSLLDVIFIILLVVLCGQSGINQSLSESQAEAEAARAEAQAEHDLYQDMLDTADNLNQYVWAASIAVPYNKDEITNREIKLLVEGKEIDTFSLVGNDVTESLDNFENCLISYINSNSDRPVILSLNEEDDKILYRDEVKVNDILSGLAKRFDNVYIKGSISEE